MREERDLKFSPAPSSVKPILAAAGALVGLLLLVCGGAAGYVALTSPPRQEEQAPINHMDMPHEFEEYSLKMKKRHAQEIPATDDPGVVRKIAASIFDIDLPADFEPIEAQRHGSTRRAVFGKKNESSALLKLVGADSREGDKAVATSSDDASRRQALQMAETDGGRFDTSLRSTRQKMEPVQRELMVLGQKSVFEFRQGKQASGKKSVWHVSGAFRTATGLAVLIYMVPESDFDEEAVVRMIESIRAAPDEVPDADEKSVPLQPIPEESIPGKSTG